MPDQLLRSAYIASKGPLVLHGETLIGIIVKDTYVFSTAHTNASEVTAYEVEPVSTESRLTGTCAVVLNDAETAWLPLVTGTTAVDLSDVEDRGGIVWVRPGASDAVRKIIGWAADIGPDDAAYLPTWPDGLYAELIAPISGSDPLALGDLSDTDTDGVNAGDSLVFDGATWVPGNAGTPDLLNPTTHAGPGTSAGVDGLVDVGSAGVDYEAVPGAAVPVPANAWTGNKVFNQFSSTVGTAGYPSAGFEYHARGVYAALRLRDPAAGWTEISTVHAYSDGDTDETHDYGEIAIVQDNPAGLCLGWNGRVNDSLPEYKFVTDPVDVPLFDREFDLDVTLDPATGEIEFFVDGVSKGGGVIEEDGTDDPPSLPLTMTAPASTCDILSTRGAIGVSSWVWTEYGDSTVLMGIDEADSGGPGDKSFVSHGRTWTGGGRVTGPFTRPVLAHGGWTRPSWPVPASQTWVLPGLDVIDGADDYGGSAWWEADILAALSGDAGWGFGHATGVVEYGFAISDGTTSLLIDAGALPTEPGMIAAVLDRGTDELRLYTWTETDGLALADTVDASALGTVDPPSDVGLFSSAAALLSGSATAYDRVLTPLELEYLARNIPPLPDTVGSGGAGPDLSDATPEALGTADPGTSPDASRVDHVHEMPSAADVGAATASDITSAINALVGAAPGALDTLDELAAALADDASFAATMTTALAGKQPVDADLTAIAALATDAFGRELLTKASAAAVRSYIGLVLGTDAQAFNADLAAIAALSPSNDDIIQRKAGAWVNRTMAQLKTDLSALDPFILTCPGATPTLLSTVTNYAFAMRCHGAGTISKIALQIGTSSGNICVGVYSSTGVAYNAVPDARLATSGSVACPSTGWQEVALGASVDVKTGDWLVVAFDNSTATVFGVASPGSGLANHGLSRAQSSAFPLPSTFTPAASGDRQVRLWGIP